MTMLHAVSARRDAHVAHYFMGGPGYDRSLGPFSLRGSTPVPVAEDMFCFALPGDNIVVKLRFAVCAFVFAVYLSSVHYRPGWAEFLRVLSLYELHIYTMGTRDYAAAIVKILDPTRTLFSGQVFSRDDFSQTVSGVQGAFAVSVSFLFLCRCVSVNGLGSSLHD